MQRHSVLKRILSFALLAFAAFGLAACNETTTTQQTLPLVEGVGSFDDYDALKLYLSDFFQSNGNGWYYYRNMYMADTAEGALDTPTTTAAQGSQTGAEEEIDRTHSISNDQVQGVAEPDTIMTDGYYIYVVSGEKFLIVDADTLDIVYTYTTPETSYSYFYGMFLDETTHQVVLLASEYTYSEEQAQNDAYYYWYWYRYGTRVLVFDVADPAAATIERDLFFENTSMVDARMIDGQVYLVLDNYMVNYGFRDDAFVPVYRDSAVSETEQLVAADHIFFMPNDNYSLCYLMLVSFDLATPDEAANVDAYIGSSWQIYMSAENLYVVVYRYDDTAGWYDYSTYVLRFAIADGRLTFGAIGKVDGSPLNQFSMDEYAGTFRIATTEFVYHYVAYDDEGHVVTTIPAADGETTRSADAPDVTEPRIFTWTWTVQNSLFVLDATTEGTMGILGSITENLGKPNEQIRSVRFSGDFAYVVTAENTDPMYKLDLSVPTDPRIVGAYEEPGVNDYLHEIIKDQLILGVGRMSATVDGFTRFTGVKVSLYDVTGDDPVATDVYEVEGDYSYTPVIYDQKAFISFAPEGADYWLVAIPVYEYFEGYSRSTQSLYVFRAGFDGNLDLLAKLTHNDELSDQTWYYESIERAVIIGTRIYTVSYAQIRMYDMAADFAFSGRTILNDGYYGYYFGLLD